MVAVKSLIRDASLEVLELGGSTAKKAGQAVRRTLNPFEQSVNVSQQNKELQEKLQQNKSTPLDMEKLRKQHEVQDNAKADELRRRLFQLVKQGDEETLQRDKQEEADRKRQELEEVEGKKKEETQAQQTPVEAPKGKVRKNILSPKKQVQREHTEIKPSTGKS